LAVAVAVLLLLLVGKLLAMGELVVVAVLQIMGNLVMRMVLWVEQTALAVVAVEELWLFTEILRLAVME
jgi:hypothetical protein